MTETLTERIARIRETHIIVRDFPECPNCGEGCPGHGEVAFCEMCLNDEGPCDVLVVAAELEKLLKQSTTDEPVDTSWVQMTDASGRFGGHR